jgi:alcohol dehydrogenase
MKALVYTQPNEMQIQDRPYPSLESGEVILKIESVGICGSDMQCVPRSRPQEESLKVWYWGVNFQGL